MIPHLPMFLFAFGFQPSARLPRFSTNCLNLNPHRVNLLILFDYSGGISYICRWKYPLTGIPHRPSLRHPHSQRDLRPSSGDAQRIRRPHSRDNAEIKSRQSRAMARLCACVFSGIFPLSPSKIPETHPKHSRKIPDSGRSACGQAVHTPSPVAMSATTQRVKATRSAGATRICNPRIPALT